MKKLFLLLVLLLSISSYIEAQNYTEVVYLKNGSIIKGLIIEQVPNVSLKVKTPDGSLIICQMSDVEKITKEEQITQKEQWTKISSTASKTTLRGYKGFIDFAYTANVDYDNASKVEFSTTHGYQFNNHFFLGAGIAVHHYIDADVNSVPIYANVKANFLRTKITPFADVKSGYSVGDVEGAYASIGIGVHFSLKGKKALNLALVYDYQGSETAFDHEYYHYDVDNSLQSIGIRFGFEF